MLKTNGTGRSKLLDSNKNTEYGAFLNVDNGWIYYSNAYDGRMRKMRISDGYWTDISSYEVGFINIIKNNIYFEATEDDSVLLRITNGGSGYSRFGVNINKIQDSNITVLKGDEYTLPSTIKAERLDGSIRELNVTWKTDILDTTKKVNHLVFMESGSSIVLIQVDYIK